MGDPNELLIVRALYPYSPLNNDELQLNVGDVITITQNEPGGWWEGTLNGKTGWFPSNYVEVISPSVNGISTDTQILLDPVSSLDLNANVEQAEYQRISVRDLLESEKNFVKEMQSLWDNFLLPLEKAQLLDHTEYFTLIGNYSEVFKTHQTLLIAPLTRENGKPHSDQKIGKLFLEKAPLLESVHKAYCSNHPRAVQVIEKRREDLGLWMEKKGMKSPGLLSLIEGLSLPFRRLEKYSRLLIEIECHMEESHKDRGNLQRSVEYYKLLDRKCVDVRKQKEMELEVLSGAIKHWEGCEVSKLGEIKQMSPVFIGPEKLPRYFVLFPSTLLILSCDMEENNTFVFEGKIPVTGIRLNSLPDTESLTNAFEITGPMIESKVVSCLSKSLKDTWIENINSILKSTRFPSVSISQVPSFSNGSPPYVELVAYLRMLYETGEIQNYLDSVSLTTSNLSPKSLLTCYQPEKAQLNSSTNFSFIPKSLTIQNICVHLRDAKNKNLFSTLSHNNFKLRNSVSFDTINTNKTSSLYKSRENLSDLSSCTECKMEALLLQYCSENDGLKCKKESLTCRSQSLPVMKFTYNSDQQSIIVTPSSPSSIVNSNHQRKKLVRQDAFDYGDEDETVVENIIDLNDNLSLTRINLRQESVDSQQQSSYGSFDSGVDDFMVSNSSSSA